MKRIAAILFSAGLVSAVSAQTNTPAVRAMTLRDCITEALKHNFDIRIERYQPLIAQLGLDAAYAGYDPALTLQGAHFHNNPAGLVGTNGSAMSDYNSFNPSLGGSLPLGTTYSLFGNVQNNYFPAPENTGGQVGVNAAQPLLKNLWIDNTRLQILTAKNTIKSTEQDLRSQLITTITAVENAYYELIYARENVDVNQQALDLAQTQLDEDRQRVEIGTIAERAGTLEQDEAQVAQNHATLIAAQLTLKQDENTLKNLITDNYAQWHDLDIQPTETLEAVRQFFDLQNSWTKGLTSRPDYLKAKITLEQEGIQLKYDWNQLFPELDVTASYGYNGDGTSYDQAFGDYVAGNRPFYSYGGKLVMPLANLAARSTYKSDKAAQQQDLLKLKQQEQTVLVAIDDAVKQAESDWDSVQASKQQRVYAQAALDAEEKKYSVGKSTTFTVLQLQNNLTAAKSQEIRDLANYNKDLTALAEQEGSTLERRNVEITTK